MSDKQTRRISSRLSIMFALGVALVFSHVSDADAMTKRDAAAATVAYTVTNGAPGPCHQGSCVSIKCLRGISATLVRCLSVARGDLDSSGPTQNCGMPMHDRILSSESRWVAQQ